MKIVHLCLACFFPDNYSYQENMLPKFHKQLGNEVEVIASLETFDKDGNKTYMSHGCEYSNEYNIQVTRLEYKKPNIIYRKLKRYTGTYEAIKKASPDILFIHGCQFLDMDKVVKYVKENRDVTVYVDNHADYSNSGTNFFSANILHKKLWKHSAQMINPYTRKFYGVLPARVDWLIDMYGLSSEKCELLVMGADDELVRQADKEKCATVRSKYGISSDDFLIVTGGKIDLFKTQTINLMEAVKLIDSPKVKLIVFGSVVQELKDKVKRLVDNVSVFYEPWLTSEQSYIYFGAANLVVFPGRHSVYWEQTVGMGIPMVCKYWDGTTHIDIGGNVIFIKEDTIEEMYKIINELLRDKEKYNSMLKIAQGEEKNRFLYSDIAKRAITQ